MWLNKRETTMQKVNVIDKSDGLKIKQTMKRIDFFAHQKVTVLFMKCAYLRSILTPEGAKGILNRNLFGGFFYKF